jgi:cyclic pyranopterin phosphate synthase
MPGQRYSEQYRFLPRSELLTFEEIARLAALFVQLGATKLRLTGGEPLLRKDLHVLVSMLSAIEGVEDLALTTNGTLLSGQARALRQAGLDRVTVSLDSLDPEVFAEMSGGRGNPRAVLEGITQARAVGLAPIKINVVVQRGVNESGVLDLVELARDAGHIVRFIEYMDVGNLNGWRDEHVVPSRELLARIHERYPVVPLERRYHGEVAERYRFVDGGGEIGFISSVSEPFCGECTRARLSADGRAYSCLFATQAVDLRGPIRNGASDDDLRAIITGTWRQRTDRYSEQRAELRAQMGAARKVEMFQVGG